MTSNQIISNPFAQMMDPQAVFAAVERSERLQRLQSHICRPLDKVLVTAAAAEESAELDVVSEPAAGAEAA